MQRQSIKKTSINEYGPVGTGKLKQLKTPGSISPGTFLFRFKQNYNLNSIFLLSLYANIKFNIKNWTFQSCYSFTPDICSKIEVYLNKFTY